MTNVVVQKLTRVAQLQKFPAFLSTELRVYKFDATDASWFNSLKIIVMSKRLVIIILFLIGVASSATASNYGSHNK